MKKVLIYDLCLTATLSSVLFVQEQLLAFLPNIQLTIFLLILFSKKLGFVQTSFIVLIYTTLDCLLNGGLHVLYFPFMLLGWLLIPLTLSTVFKKVTAPLFLGFLAILYAFCYSWIFLIPNYLIYQIDPVAYLITDLAWEALLAASGFLSTVWFYRPCEKLMDIIKRKDR